MIIEYRDGMIMCPSSDDTKNEYCSRCSKACRTRLWDINEDSNYEAWI